MASNAATSHTVAIFAREIVGKINAGSHNDAVCETISSNTPGSEVEVLANEGYTTGEGFYIWVYIKGCRTTEHKRFYGPIEAREGAARQFIRNKVKLAFARADQDYFRRV